MAKIKPFQAIRPSRDKVHLVTSRTYVSYSRRDLRDKLAGNPFTFIHIINPETGEGIKTRPHSKARFEKVKDKFREFQDLEILQRDAEENFYIYRQIKDGTRYTGIICGISIDDYLNGTIKVHEQTITKRENMFRDYLDTTNFNAEPVLLAYEDRPAVHDVVNKYCAQRAEWDYSTTDWARHQMWLINDPEDMRIITEEFALVDSVYIADGHHRTASSALLGVNRRNQNPNDSEVAPYNYCMSMLIPSSELRIYDFNRVVKNLNGMRTEKFLQLLAENIEVTPMDHRRKPANLHEIGMYLDGKWYSLRIKHFPESEDPAQLLDARLLTTQVLSPILDIHDLKTDKRVDFIPGVYGLEALEKAVDEGKFRVAFALFPVTFEALKEVSDHGSIMPPKSTYIEPKMRSGLTIMELS